ncbi:hypothetical protein GCM10009578_076750 [Streptomyces rhizosphaericus]
MQGDLVLGLADVGTGQGGIPVLVHDRLALDADFFPAHRTVCCTSSVTTYLRSRARPVSRRSVPTCMRSSERVMAPSPRTPMSAEDGMPGLSPVPVWAQPTAPGWLACCQAASQPMP